MTAMEGHSSGVPRTLAGMNRHGLFGMQRIPETNGRGPFPKDPPCASLMWPWVKIQIVPPVNIPISTKIGSKMGGAPTLKNVHRF